MCATSASRFPIGRLRNEMYNASAVPLEERAALPVSDQTFDVIWLFSVFTHLSQKDAQAMLSILRRVSRPHTSLLLRLHRPEAHRFRGSLPEEPLRHAYFGEELMRRLVMETGWKLEQLFEKEPHNFIQHHLLCRPG